MEELKYLTFDIQMFADNTADNDTSDEGEPAGVELDDTTSDAPSNEVNNEPVDKTKAFSERLKQKTKEVENKFKKEYEDKLLNIAKINGYNSWEEMEKSNNKNALIDAGVEDIEKVEGLIKKLIEQNPDVIEAKRIIEKNKEREEELTLNEELEKINKIDNSISTLDDISKLDNCQEIIDKLNKGYSLYDAYILSNFNNIKTNIKEASKKSALNNIDSKSHMKTTTGGNSDNINIPQDVLAMYRKNLKGWTDKQIKEHYEKQMNKK